MKKLSAILLLSLTTSVFAGGVMDQAPFKQGPVQDTKMPLPSKQDPVLPQQDVLPQEPIGVFGMLPSPKQPSLKQPSLKQQNMQQQGMQQQGMQQQDAKGVDTLQQNPAPFGGALLPSGGAGLYPGVGYDSAPLYPDYGVSPLYPDYDYGYGSYPIGYRRGIDLRFGGRFGHRFGGRFGHGHFGRRGHFGHHGRRGWDNDRRDWDHDRRGMGGHRRDWDRD